MNNLLTWALLLFVSPLFGQTYLMNGAPIASCSGIFYDNGGENGNYSNNQNLSTTICPDNGKYLRLRFTGFQLGPGDELCIRDGSSVLTPILTCSNSFPPTPPFSVQASPANTGGCLTLTFTSDAGGTAAGWAAVLSCEEACFVAAPANLRVVEISNGNMTWSWDAVSQSTGYEVSVSGGGWIPTNGNLTHTVSGLAPGDQVVLELRAVADTPGCIPVSTSAGKTYLNCTLEAGIDALEPAVCPGTATGSAFIITNGALGAVQYFVDNNPAPYPTGDLVNLFAAGDHSVVAVDTAGCRDTIFFTITEPQTLVALFDSIRDAKCFGGDDGYIRATGNGGTPPYTYVWQGCQGGPLLPGAFLQDIFAGCYAVTVTDDNGCTAAAQDSVREGIKYKFMTSQDSVSCFGGMDGRATVSASGAKPPYTYLWANGDTTATADSLKAGLYAVSVTDMAGCTAVTLVEVKEPRRLVIDSIVITQVSCFGGNNGSAAVAINNGGTPAYTFNWNDAKTGQTITNLTAGAYTVTVSDQKGCTAISSTMIGQPPDLLLTTQINAETCSGACNGNIALTPSGGAGAYGISWNQPGIPPGNFTPQNLCPGAYQATVTDANTCSKTVQAVIQPAVPIEIKRTVQAPLCAGDQNGSLDAQVSGGAPPYQYLWSNGATGNAIQNLSCGIFTLTITDSLNCVRAVSDTLPCPTPIVLDSIVATPVRCFGEANGEIRVYAGGGTGMLTYLWSDPNQQFDPLAVNLLPGVYTVTVSDAGGCSLTASANVTQPPALSVSIQSANVTCFGGSDGAAKSAAIGGLMPYMYKWSSGQSSDTITGLTAGAYNLTVTDAAGCTFTGANAVITQPSTPLQITIDQTKLACFGVSDGEALATANGNNGAPFNYQWSHNFNGPAPANLGAGTYTVTVSDQKQCTGTQSIAIQQWSEITIGFLRSPPTCHNGNDAQIAVNKLIGGAGNGDFSRYRYAWSIPGAPDTLFVKGLTGGAEYSLTVTDEAGCSASIDFTMLNQPPIMVILETDSARCFGLSDGVVRITGVQSPNPIATYTWNNSNTGMEQSGLPAGVYTVTITDTQGCTTTAEATVGAPPLLLLQLEVDNLVCNQDSNGIINATAEGGTPGYSYMWNTGATTAQIGNLGPGWYRITLTDSRQCTVVDSVFLAQPNSPDIQVETTHPSCHGAKDGLVRLNVTGTAPPYRYSLDGAMFGGSSVFLGLGAGTYVAFVRDGNGCITAFPFTLDQPLPVEVTFGPDTTVILGDSLLLTPDIFNAVGLAGYSWRSALADSFLCVDIPDCSAISVKPAYSNTYFVTVTDANGCRGEGSTRVEVIKPRGVYVPTGFSPNNDGNNDFLVVYGKSRQIKQIKVFRVYDRWGELVYEDLNFEVNNEQRGWNGRFRGDDAQTGVYVWYLEAEYADGYVESLRGNTVLVR